MKNNEYFVHPSTYIDDNCSIGKGTKIWHFSHIMSNSEIGDNCNIGQNVVISPKVKIGNGVKIQNNVSLYTGIICADDVFIGPSVVFTNVINPRSAIARTTEFKSTVIEKGVSIGANATIICGINLGKYSFVGAGAVVTKSVKPYALVVGNPAKQSGWMSEAGYKLKFDDSGIAFCPEKHEKYELSKNEVNKITE